MTLVLPTTLVQGTTANAPDVMSDLNAIVNYINNVIGPSQIPSGSETIWLQATAPTGWTQDVTKNDRALRLVNDGSGGSTGGSWTISGLTGASHTHTYITPNHDHTVTINGHVLTLAELAPHAHNVALNLGTGGANAAAGGSSFAVPPVTPGQNYVTDTQGGGAAHTHTAPNTGLTADDVGGTTAASGTLAIAADGNWRPAYANVLAATKN